MYPHLRGRRVEKPFRENHPQCARLGLKPRSLRLRQSVVNYPDDSKTALVSMSQVPGTHDSNKMAARDGTLEVLKEATRRDCNAKDEDGMTPTLWAAFEGNLEALRLLAGRGSPVGGVLSRGNVPEQAALKPRFPLHSLPYVGGSCMVHGHFRGDVDKADNFGNTALHFAAARGHMNCVSFLANFGANLWSLDIDFHTAKELAAMNNRDEVLRFLDMAAAKEETANRKGVRSMKEKAEKDAKKRSKEFEKLKKKADKQAKKENENQKKQREKMTITEQNDVNIMPHRPSNVLTALKMGYKGHSMGTLGSVSKNFSEIVAPMSGGNSAGRKTTTSNIQKKVQKKLKGQMGTGSVHNVGDFKVGEIEDGKRSLRSLTGLRRDSEIIYVGTYDTAGGGKRGKIADVFETNGELNRSVSEPDFLHNPDSGFSDEVLLHEPASMFDRPGFGSVVFRNTIAATLSELSASALAAEHHRCDPDWTVRKCPGRCPPVTKCLCFRNTIAATLSELSTSALAAVPLNTIAATLSGLSKAEDKDSAVVSTETRGGEDISIGSAGSLAHSNLPWDQEDVDSDDGTSDTEWSPLQLFLVSAGLGEYVPRFVSEEIDLEALVLLTDKDFDAMGIPIGPKRKLMAAVERRKAALADPGEVADSRL
uniref:SAM domain-containing protein n=1 Tax=Timema genevievae TaxID=629358 RepID=A0A7R9PIB2_TIMGE|nr:unnamed protein product [Timema genevievae]